MRITVIKQVVCYGSVTRNTTQMTEQMLCTFERKTSRKIYGPIQDKGRWRPRRNSKIYNLYKDLNIVCNIKIRKLRWAGHIIRMENERIPIKFLNTLNAELNPICYLLALLGAHHFLHVSRIRVKSLTLRQLMS